MKEIEIGSDFSGIGAFEQALKRLEVKYVNRFACDKDKFARKSYLANYDAPEDFPEDVYERKIPKKPLDIYMTSPPCQSFSIAGKQEGKDSEKGILFFNSHEFIEKNKPAAFVFENVRGLLSDDKTDKKQEFGKTFSEWLNYLGGKSINGLPVIFPYEKSVPYHIYWTVLNSTDYDIPQNRERVFIVGIRDDKDNLFQWPKELQKTKTVRSVLEVNVDEKYYLSEKMIKGLMKEKTAFKGRFKPLTGDEPHVNCITTNAGSRLTDNFICEPVQSVGRKNKKQNGRRFKETGEPMFTITTTDTHGIYDGQKIRRLTPRECIRFQDFPDDFKFVVSDTQLYKQAGNSISVGVLTEVVKKILNAKAH